MASGDEGGRRALGAGAGWGGFRRLARGVLSIAVTGGNRNVGRLRVAETLNKAWGHLVRKGKTK